MRLIVLSLALLLVPVAEASASWALWEQTKVGGISYFEEETWQRKQLFDTERQCRKALYAVVTGWKRPLPSGTQTPIEYRKHITDDTLSVTYLTPKQDQARQRLLAQCPNCGYETSGVTIKVQCWPSEMNLNRKDMWR